MGLRMGNAEACVTDCKAQLKLPLLLQKVEPDSTYRNCCNILTIAQNATLSNNYNATARQVAFQYVLYKTYLNIAIHVVQRFHNSQCDNAVSVER